jgi:hypothetical protein
VLSSVFIIYCVIARDKSYQLGMTQNTNNNGDFSNINNMNNINTIDTEFVYDGNKMKVFLLHLTTYILKTVLEVSTYFKNLESHIATPENLWNALITNSRQTSSSSISSPVKNNTSGASYKTSKLKI